MPQPIEMRIVCLRCADVSLCGRVWSARSAAVPTSESSSWRSMITMWYLLCLENAVEPMDYKFLINYVRLQQVCMHPPRSDPDAVIDTTHIGDQCLMRADVNS